MNRLRVDFDGLTGLVPDRKATTKKKPSAYTVVLPNLTEGLRVDQISRRLHPHIPCVVVPTDSVVKEERKHALLRFRARRGRYAGRDYSLYVFDNERLELVYANPSKLTADLPLLNLKNPPKVPKPGEEHQLHWIPRLAYMQRPKAEQFDRGRFVDRSWVPKPGGDVQLSGTVRITSGDLRVSDVVRPRGKAAVLDFLPEKGSGPLHEQAIVDELVWSDRVAANRLALEFRRRSRNQPGIVTVRRLDRVFDVHVSNLELEVLLGLGSPGRAAVDRDFGAFYLYAKKVPPPKEGFPIPHIPKTAAGGGLRCKYPLFEGWI